MKREDIIKLLKGYDLEYIQYQDCQELLADDIINLFTTQPPQSASEILDDYLATYVELTGMSKDARIVIIKMLEAYAHQQKEVSDAKIHQHIAETVEDTDYFDCVTVLELIYNNMEWMRDKLNK